MRNGRIERGRRVFCSNRGRRGGCGRTFSIFAAGVLPRHTLNAALLWELLRALLGQPSLKAAAEALGLSMALSSLYGARRRLRRRMETLRTRLCGRQAPPASAQADALAQTVEHFQAVFPTSSSPLAEFQLAFQEPLFG